MGIEGSVSRVGGSILGVLTANEPQSCRQVQRDITSRFWSRIHSSGLVLGPSHGSRLRTSELRTPVPIFFVFEDEEVFLAVLHDVTVDSLKMERQITYPCRIEE